MYVRLSAILVNMITYKILFSLSMIFSYPTNCLPLAVDMLKAYPNLIQGLTETKAAVSITLACNSEDFRHSYLRLCDVLKQTLVVTHRKENVLTSVKCTVLP